MGGPNLDQNQQEMPLCPTHSHRALRLAPQAALRHRMLISAGREEDVPGQRGARADRGQAK